MFEKKNQWLIVIADRECLLLPENFYRFSELRKLQGKHLQVTNNMCKIFKFIMI
jgi:hypothetical protein